MAKNQLRNLDVDRVDGVDKPATGRSFLLFKSEDGDAIMKGYGMVATAADAVLKSLRKDAHATVSRKSAIALNGLAQVMGGEPVFVGKSVPTQPYLFTEPDADKRGPADEDLGPNFTPRSMPGSMVGSVSFRMKDEDDDEDASKTAKSAAKAAKDADAMYDDDADDKKSKTAATKTADVDVAAALVAMAKSIADLPGAIVAAEKAAIAKMQGEGEQGDDTVAPVKKSAKSRQIDTDEAPIRKSSEEGPRLGVSFADVVFKK